MNYGIGLNMGTRNCIFFFSSLMLNIRYYQIAGKFLVSLLEYHAVIKT